VSVVFGQVTPAVLPLSALGVAGFEIVGPPGTLEEGSSDSQAGPTAGSSVSGAGDVNGDGRGDVLVGAPGASPRSRLHAGSAFVVFGKQGNEPVQLGNLAGVGFRVDGDRPHDQLGQAVASAGDTNGDGLSDVALTTAANQRTPGAALAYVVYGRRTSEPVDTRQLGSGGYRIIASRGLPGVVTVRNAGDVNGDGRADLLVAVDNLGVFVVFGQVTEGDVDLSRLGGKGFVIEGAMARPQAAAAGDVNGDGRADVLIGEPDSAKAFVVFGKSDSRPVSLPALGSRGYEIYDHARSSDLAEFVMNAGDVNGDGRPDQLVSDGSDIGADHFYLVFGRRGPGRIDVRHLGTAGIDLIGPWQAADSTVIYEAAAPGDLNGDGHADLALGAAEYDRDCRTDLGALYVIYGRSGPGRIDVNRLLPNQGYRLEGHPGDAAGSVVQAPGDTNGDGHPDLLVGAIADDPFEPPNGFSLQALTGRPILQNRPDYPLAQCLRARLIDANLAHIRAHGLRVRVSLRRLQRAPEDVELQATATRGPFARFSLLIPPSPIALGAVRFRHPGTRTATLALTPTGRKAVRSSTPLRIRLTITDAHTDDLDHQINARLHH